MPNRLPARALMVGSLGAAGAFGVWQALRTSMIDMNGHCGDDGAKYCAMAQGVRVARPFKNRILGPLLVRGSSFTGWSIVHRFLLLDLVFGALALVMVGLLVRSVATELGAEIVRASQFGVVGAALVFLNPWMWHWVVSYPVMSDVVALGCGLAWVHLYRSRAPDWVPALLALATVTAREAWFVPVLVVVAADWRWWSRSARRAALSGGAAVMGFVAVTLAPYFEAPGHEYSTLGALKEWVVANFTRFGGLVMLAWFAVFGLGLVPLVLLGRLSVLRRSTGAMTLGLLAAAHLVLALVGGGDTDRLFVPTCALLVVLAMAVVAADARLDLVAGALVVATVLEWRPWQIVSPTPLGIEGAPVARGFWSFWSARDLSDAALHARIAHDAALIAVPLAVAAVLAVRLRRQARPLAHGESVVVADA